MILYLLWSEIQGKRKVACTSEKWGFNYLYAIGQQRLYSL